MREARFRPDSLSHGEELVLDRVKVAVHTHLSPQMAHDAAVDTYADYMSDRMVVQLKTDVLRHRVDAQDVRIPFSRTETAAIPGPRFLTQVAALLVLLGMVLGFATSSVPIFLFTSAIALAFVVLYASNPPAGVTVTAEGEAVVHREQFNSFPENTVVYPKGLGGPVRVATWADSLAYSDGGHLR